MFNEFFFRAVYETVWKYIVQADTSQMTVYYGAEKMQKYRHTLKICNTFCISTVTVVTFYVRCLSCNIILPSTRRSSKWSLFVRFIQLYAPFLPPIRRWSDRPTEGYGITFTTLLMLLSDAIPKFVHRKNSWIAFKVNRVVLFFLFSTWGSF
jgi:hypothetical protein